MFDKLKLKPFLLAVFSIIIALTAILTMLNAVGLLIVKNSMQNIMNETSGVDLAVKNCRIEVNSAARNLRDMVFTNIAQDRLVYKESIEGSMANINEQLAIFKEYYGTEDGLAEKYDQAFQAWYAVAQTVMQQVFDGDQVTAKHTVLEQCTPTLNALEKIAKQISVKTDELRAGAEARTQHMILSFIGSSLIMFLIVLLISIVFALKTTSKISATTAKIKKAAHQLSKGNLKARVEYNGQNEFGDLAKSLNAAFDELAKYVKAIDEGMTQFSRSDFSYDWSVEFIGDFAHIQRAIMMFQDRMRNVLAEMQIASSQVGDGAAQVASGAQSLAQGATEQASSTQELTATINDISNQLEQSAEYSRQANDLGKQANDVVRKSHEEMQQMVHAIKDIARASQDIQMIIQTINEIAFQTNILALNAAVEAARAGAAGKGFAVVASEVRNLAQKCAEAAKNTTDLIEHALESVARGEKLAVSTGEAFEEVATYASDILAMVEKIAQASNEQSVSISQITLGVDQISSVIQQNSAASEQSAAASEQLSSQADMMHKMIGQFVLEKNVNIDENASDQDSPSTEEK